MDINNKHRAYLHFWVALPEDVPEALPYEQALKGFPLLWCEASRPQVPACHVRASTALVHCTGCRNTSRPSHMAVVASTHQHKGPSRGASPLGVVNVNGLGLCDAVSFQDTWLRLTKARIRLSDSSSWGTQRRQHLRASPLGVVDVNGLGSAVEVPCQDDWLLLAEAGKVL